MHTFTGAQDETMQRYIARIDLHDASPAEYEKLNKAMLAEGFSQMIDDTNKNNYQLPTGEYCRLDEIKSMLKDVFDKAQRAANNTYKPNSVIVSKVEMAMWDGLPIVKPVQS